jgi:hypothetical protein
MRSRSDAARSATRRSASGTGCAGCGAAPPAPLGALPSRDGARSVAGSRRGPLPGHDRHHVPLPHARVPQQGRKDAGGAARAPAPAPSPRWRGGPGPRSLPLRHLEEPVLQCPSRVAPDQRGAAVSAAPRRGRARAGGEEAAGEGHGGGDGGPAPASPRQPASSAGPADPQSWPWVAWGFSRRAAPSSSRAGLTQAPSSRAAAPW